MFTIKIAQVIQEYLSDAFFCSFLCTEYTFRFQKFAYGPLVHAWSTGHFQKNETVFCVLARKIPDAPCCMQAYISLKIHHVFNFADFCRFMR